MTTGSVGAQGFLSYTRKDNEQFEGVVDKLKTQLEGRFAASTGRELQIFIDRESIGWGEDWRARIRESVKTATFFIPVITMRYFDSDMCREELLAFYENAKQLGVTELILPVVLTGSEEITASDPREEVQLIESLNYKNIEDAWLSGYGSAEWLRAIHEMVTGLKKGLATAETALAEQESSPGITRAAESQVAVQEQGSNADISALGSDLENLTALLGRASSVMQTFGEAASESTTGVDLGALPPNQQQAALLRMAHVLRGPAKDMGDVGAELDRRMGAMDANLRAVVEELRSINAEMAQEQLNTLLTALEGAEDIGAVVRQMEQFVEVLRFAAMMNVSLRKSLHPAIQGIQSIGNAVATFKSWRSI